MTALPIRKDYRVVVHVEFSMIVSAEAETIAREIATIITRSVFGYGNYLHQNALYWGVLILKCVEDLRPTCHHHKDFSRAEDVEVEAYEAQGT